MIATARKVAAPWAKSLRLLCPARQSKARRPRNWCLALGLRGGGSEPGRPSTLVFHGPHGDTPARRPWPQGSSRACEARQSTSESCGTAMPAPLFPSYDSVVSILILLRHNTGSYPVATSDSEMHVHPKGFERLAVQPRCANKGPFIWSGLSKLIAR